MLEAIADWTNRFGEPPRLVDWDPGLARRSGRVEMAERFEQERPRYPPSYRARQLFGSWNEALAAAGHSTTQAGLKRSSTRPQAHAERGPTHSHAWTLEEALLAIQDHNATHGEPPRFDEWASRDPARARPTAATVQSLAGSWNAAIEQAGLALRRTGSGRPVALDVRAAAVARYLDGEPTTRIGRDLGISASAVGRWVRQAGNSVRPRGARVPHRRV